MYKIFSLVIISAIINGIFTHDEIENYFGEPDKNPWQPVLGPFGDRAKPLKVNPKHGDKFLFNVNPSNPLAYMPGLYTFPYYAYGEFAPYQTFLKPYVPYYDNFNAYIRKNEKDKPYVPEYKN